MLSSLCFRFFSPLLMHWRKLNLNLFPDIKCYAAYWIDVSNAELCRQHMITKALPLPEDIVAVFLDADHIFDLVQVWSNHTCPWALALLAFTTISLHPNLCDFHAFEEYGKINNYYEYVISLCDRQLLWKSNRIFNASLSASKLSCASNIS